MQEKLQKYVELLLKWNAKINLIAKSTEQEIWDRHIEDSLQLLEHIPESSLVIDFGSGGGLPAIPIAIAGYNVVMVESDKRKSTFLNEAIRQLSLNAEVENTRAENLQINLTNENQEVIITARAFADLEKIFEISHSFLANHKIKNYKLILLKGENVSRETLSAKENWEFEIEQIPSKTNRSARILLVNGLKLAKKGA